MKLNSTEQAFLIKISLFHFSPAIALMYSFIWVRNDFFSQILKKKPAHILQFSKMFKAPESWKIYQKVASFCFCQNWNNILV